MHYLRVQRHGDPHYVWTTPVKTCTVAGCGRTDNIVNGLCSTHYQRLRRLGAPDAAVRAVLVNRTLEERFWYRTNKKGPNDCWPWTGGLSMGYGNMGVGGTTRKTHVISWELHYGQIPAGMEVCHSCDYRACNNPRHLFLGTHADNMADMARKQRNRRGEAHRWAKLTAADVRRIRQLIANGVSYEAIAKQFGVSYTPIQAIASGRTWRHVK